MLIRPWKNTGVHYSTVWLDSHPDLPVFFEKNREGLVDLWYNDYMTHDMMPSKRRVGGHSLPGWSNRGRNGDRYVGLGINVLCLRSSQIFIRPYLWWISLLLCVMYSIAYVIDLLAVMFVVCRRGLWRGTYLSSRANRQRRSRKSYKSRYVCMCS